MKKVKVAVNGLCSMMFRSNHWRNYTLECVNPAILLHNCATPRKVPPATFAPL